MPELPDVEVLKRYLDSTSLHKKIEDVDLKEPLMLEGISKKKFESGLKGHKFALTRRHGKYLLVELDDENWLEMHFGMTGDLKAYNDAWENYEEEEGGELNRDGVAHRQGIHAVENEYLLEQKTGNWVPHEKAQEYLEERKKQQAGEEDGGTLGDIADIRK